MTLEPIEQNVQSTGFKGIYELTPIEIKSKQIHKFRKEADKFSSITEGKTDDEIEKLVSWERV